MYAASLLLIYLALSGSLFATYAFTRGFNDKPGDMLGFASLSLIAGLLTNLSLVLIFRSVLIAFALGALLSLGGFSYLFWQRDRLTLTPFAYVQTRASKYLRALTLLVCILLAGALLIWALYLPIVGWDARSIWFFHAKMIYFAGGLFSDNGWTNPAFNDHANYPKLIAVLGAQIATLNGQWNDFVPLSSISMLIVIECVALAYLFRSLLFIILFLSLTYSVLGLPGYYVNGYMDIHVAVFAVLTVGFLVRALSQHDPIDWLMALLTAGVTASLKNEGLAIDTILVVISCAGLCWTYWRHKNVHWSPVTPLLMALGVAAFPVVLWQSFAVIWHLHPPQPTDSGPLQRLIARLDGPSLSAIFHAVAAPYSFVAALLVAAATGFINRKKQDLSLFLPLLVSIFYFAVLWLVYMTDSDELIWLLQTSADRVTYSVKLLLMFSLALQLENILQHLGHSMLACAVCWRPSSEATPIRAARRFARSSAAAG